MKTEFLPLVYVFAAVIILTAAAALYTGADGLRLMTLFMGMFFLVFGSFKVWNLRPFAEAYRMYDLIAMRSAVYGYGYPFLELLLAVLYLTGTHLPAANAATLILMTVSAAGVFVKLRKKEEVMCACLGAVFAVPMTWVTLAEDILMAGMAAAMLVLML